MKRHALRKLAIFPLLQGSVLADLSLDDYLKVPDSCFYESGEYFGHVPEGSATFKNDLSLLWTGTRRLDTNADFSKM